MESNLEARKQGKEEKWGEETGGKDGRKKQETSKGNGKKEESTEIQE